MKNLTVLSFILVLLSFACRKDDEVKLYGELTGFMNDESWSVDDIAVYQQEDEVIGIVFSNINEYGYANEELSIVKLPYKEGVLLFEDLSPSKTRCLYSRLNSHGDALLATYYLDTTSTTNYIEITKIDEANNQIEGQLDLTFYQFYCSVQLVPAPADTLRFRDIVFSTRINR